MNLLFKSFRNIIAVITPLLVLSCILSSCGSTKEFAYMQGQFDTARLSKIPPSDPVVKKGDALSIIVYSDNPGATNLI